MTRMLIIACGNPLRTDDGIGWHIAQKLASQLRSPDFEILLRFELTPDLAEDMSHADRVILIDAAAEGVPGEVRCEAINAAEAAPAFSHECSPPVLLGLVQDLYGATPDAVLISVAGESFKVGQGLTAAVADSVPVAVNNILELVASGAKAIVAHRCSG